MVGVRFKIPPGYHIDRGVSLCPFVRLPIDKLVYINGSALFISEHIFTFDLCLEWKTVAICNLLQSYAPSKFLIGVYRGDPIWRGSYGF